MGSPRRSALGVHQNRARADDDIVNESARELTMRERIKHARTYPLASWCTDLDNYSALSDLLALIRKEERFSMDTIELRIKDGPTKPDLLWAVAYPDRHIHVHFDGDADAVSAHVDYDGRDG